MKVPVVDPCDHSIVPESTNDLVRDVNSMRMTFSMNENTAFLSFLLLGIGHDLVSMTHGMTHYGQQLLSSLQHYRQSIIEAARPGYPLKLLRLIEQILTRKATTETSTFVKKESSANCYAKELEHLNLVSSREFQFYDQLTVKNVNYKTMASTKSAKFSDCCVSFRFGSQVKIGFVRAIVQEKQGERKIFILMEDLIDDSRKQLGTYLHVNVGTAGPSSVPNIYVRIRSSCFILRSPSSLLHKHAYRILANQETVEIVEYSNLKESS